MIRVWEGKGDTRNIKIQKEKNCLFVQIEPVTSEFVTQPTNVTAQPSGKSMECVLV